MNKHTQEMLTRLTALLAQHAQDQETQLVGPTFGQRCRADAQALRRISMTLHRWHELECGNSNDHSSWCITRGDWTKTDPHRAPRQPDGSRWPREFIHDDEGRPFLERHAYNASGTTYGAIPDRERGALKRLAAIMTRYPGLTSYVQTDPRGASLYILRPGDIPEGADVSSCYSRGIAVFK